MFAYAGWYVAPQVDAVCGLALETAKDWVIKDGQLSIPEHAKHDFCSYFVVPWRWHTIKCRQQTVRVVPRSARLLPSNSFIRVRVGLFLSLLPDRSHCLGGIVIYPGSNTK